MEHIDSILNEIFPSVEMAAYLARCPFGDDIPCSRCYVFDDAPPEKLPLRRHELADAIAGAPIPLDRKRELFLRLAEDKADGFFSKLADMVSHAIQEMQLRPGEFFYLIRYRYNEEIGDSEERSVGAFLAWEHIFEAIRGEVVGEVDDEDCLTWFRVEKWTPDGNGRLDSRCDYTIVGGKVCFCGCKDLPCHEQGALDLYSEIYLPVPFHAGDIVTIDCRPFAPVSHVVILKLGDNCDCCSLLALYREGDSIWNAGTVRHRDVLMNHYSAPISPLYRLASFEGQLPEEESLLEKVSQYVNGEETRGAALCDHIFDVDKGQGVTEAQILSFIEEKRGEATI